MFWKVFGNKARNATIPPRLFIGGKNALMEFGGYWEGWQPERTPAPCPELNYVARIPDDEDLPF